MCVIKIVRMFSNRLAFWLLVCKWERDHNRPLYSFSEILPAGRKAGFTAIELRGQYVRRRAHPAFLDELQKLYWESSYTDVYRTKRGDYDY